MAITLKYNLRISLMIFKKVSMALKVLRSGRSSDFLINVVGVSIGLQLVTKILYKKHLQNSKSFADYTNANPVF